MYLHIIVVQSERAGVVGHQDGPVCAGVDEEIDGERGAAFGDKDARLEQRPPISSNRPRRLTG
jgi:hypothetical protein